MSSNYKASALAGREGKTKVEPKQKQSIPAKDGGRQGSSSSAPPAPPTPSTSSPLLGQVWPKLRVFQKEAFEFATQGKRYDRQLSLAAADDSLSSSSSSSAPLHAAKTTTVQNPYDTQGSNYLDPSLLGQGRILLADEMGLGKTVTSLAIMAHYEKEWPLLILCPASLRFTWPAEIEKFFPAIPAQSIYVVAGFQDVAFTKRKDVKVVICTYSLLQQRSAVAQVLAESAQASSSQPLFNCIIADESHNLKNKASQRTALILPLLQRARRLLLLSGTPALAAPVELWTQLHVLAPNLFGSFASYTKSYCNPQRKQIGRNRFITEYKGSSNEAELHAKIQQVMVRRLKSNVLQELPAKQRSIIPAVMTSGKEREEARIAMLDLNGGGGGDAASSLEKLLEQELGGHGGGQPQHQQGRFNADFERRSKIMRAYQTTGIGKAKAVVDYLLDWLDGSTGKILVFGHHKQVLDTIEEALFKTTTSLSNGSSGGNRGTGGQQRHIRIDGAVPTAIRANLVRKFQTSPSVRVGLLSMTAAGVGLTLTAASTVLFAELHWTPGTLAQAEDRAHRIGQQADSVNIMYAVCKDENYSLDMAMWKMLGRKIGTLGSVIDGTSEKPYLYTAQEQEQDKTKATRGTSGEDELTAFFADASASQARRKEKSPPAKGSIATFFKPKAPSTVKSKISASTTTTASKPKSSTSLSSSSSSFHETKGSTARLSSSFPPTERLVGSNLMAATTPAAALAKSNTQTTVLQYWPCKNCTYMNTKDRNSSVEHICTMCTETHLSDADLDEVDDQSSLGSSHADLLTKSTEKYQEALSEKKASSTIVRVGIGMISWTCKVCTFQNNKAHNKSAWYPCEMCSEPHVPEWEMDSDDEESSCLESATITASPRQRDGMTSTLASSRSYCSTTKRSSAPTARVSSDVIVLDKCRTDMRRGTLFNRSGETRVAKKDTGGPVEVIEIDNTPTKPSDSARRPTQMILVDDDESPSSSSDMAATQRSFRRETPPPPIVAPPKKNKHRLEFSVSKNSGRVTIHYADSGKSSQVNFDIEQVLTSDSCDALMEAKTNRGKPQHRSGSSSSRAPTLRFDPTGVNSIVQRLKRPADNNVESFSWDLQLFVRSYISLREVEKKALKDSGESFAPGGLSQSAARVMSLSLISGAPCTERYGGGAKERAIENQKNGTATPTDEAILKGKACAWCSSNLTQAQRIAKAVYCSQDCAEIGRLRRGGWASSAIRSAMFALEAGVCQKCNINAHAFYEQIMALEPAERLNRYQSAKWRLPASNKAYHGMLNNPKEGDFWQVDHKVAVAEGGGNCGLENLRTLCVPCHREETEKLRVRLKLASPSIKQNEINNTTNSSGGDVTNKAAAKNKRKQVDIRMAFFGAASSTSQKRCKQSDSKTIQK